MVLRSCVVWTVDRLLMLAFGKPKSWNATFDAAEQISEEKTKPSAAAAAPGRAKSPRRASRPEPYPIGSKGD